MTRLLYNSLSTSDKDIGKNQGQGNMQANITQYLTSLVLFCFVNSLWKNTERG